jgi:biopolymer transport protein TolQ
MDNIIRSLQQAVTAERARLERGVNFLATTGSSAPFIGLFGTVWGIMESFRNIGAMKSASLAVVAPGIAEALIATAAGLAAAIPAVIFFNYFLGRINVISTEMDNFASELINIIERIYWKRK